MAAGNELCHFFLGHERGMWEFSEGTAAAAGTDEGRVTMYVLKVRAIQARSLPACLWLHFLKKRGRSWWLVLSLHHPNWVSTSADSQLYWTGGWAGSLMHVLWKCKQAQELLVGYFVTFQIKIPDSRNLSHVKVLSVVLKFPVRFQITTITVKESFILKFNVLRLWDAVGVCATH